jgi:Holliday junction DNA helicase RuvB
MGCRLDYYDVEDLQTILHRSARILKVENEDGGLFEIARRSRGTPRIANNLLRWVRDYAQVKGENRVESDITIAALELLDIDESGLDEMDNRILEAIIFKFGGGPVGLKTLAVAVGEEVTTIEDVYEPFLIQEGYLMRTPQGRITTPKAARRFGVKAKRIANQAQPELFDEDADED